jgi:hypothetical protein
VINIYLLLFYVQTILSDVLLTESSMCGSVTFRPSVKPTFHLLNEINSLFQKKGIVDAVSRVGPKKCRQ